MVKLTVGTVVPYGEAVKMMEDAGPDYCPFGKCFFGGSRQILCGGNG